MTIRGDLAKVDIGKYCIVTSNATICPYEKKLESGVRHIPITIGDFVLVGKGSQVQAARIGSFVDIGDNCEISKDCMLSDCCRILENTVLAPGTVVPPFAIFGGSPGVMVGRLPGSFQRTMAEFMKDYYNLFASDRH